MSSAELAARYRAYAAECFVIAQKLEDAAEKSSLIVIAQAWMVLAEHADKHSDLLDKPNQ
jgi:hypothetical protein